MASRDSFTTERLVARLWTSLPESAAERDEFLSGLANLLTPPVLRPLPESLQLEQKDNALADWIEARGAESKVMTIHSRQKGDLLGLIILAEFEHPDRQTSIHLGYLFAQEAWGLGYATEIVSGLVLFLREQARPVQLLAGVENENAASVRVLQKSGFVRMQDQSDDAQSMYRLLL